MRPDLRVLTAGLVLALLAGVFAPAARAARDEELSGEAPAVQQTPSGPVWQEPGAPAPAGERGRPLLKLPEVVVKGERKVQVTAERRDLLLTDPMAGAKEMPLNVTEVAMPGFDAGKDAPAPETVTSKNLLFVLEAGLGPARLAEGRLTFGQEFTRWNYILHLEGDAGEDPFAYGFQPFVQDGSLGLDLRGEVGSGVELALSLTGRAQTRRQPSGAAAGWGDWLERGSAGAGLRLSAAPWSKASLAVEAGAGVLQEQGAPAADRQATRTSRPLSLSADLEQTLERVLPGSLELSVGYGVRSQAVSGGGTAAAPADWEALHMLRTAFTWRPIPTLNAGFGIRLGEAQGHEPMSTADVTGQAAWVLPTRSVLYALAEPELNWRPTGEWVWAQPYPTADSWLAPEHIYSRYRLGWRQTFSDLLSTDLAWFTRDASHTPIWRPQPGGTGLFVLDRLAETHLQGVEARLDLQYSSALVQTFRAVLQRPVAPDSLVWPGVPSRSAATELKWHSSGWDLAVSYRYLGERYADPGDATPRLDAAHLLGARADWVVTPRWTFFAQMDNGLGYNWSEWLGYPARRFSTLAGARMTF